MLKIPAIIKLQLNQISRVWQIYYILLNTQDSMQRNDALIENGNFEKPTELKQR